MISTKASRVLYVFVLAIALAALPAIYFQARADNSSGGSMSRTTGGCGAMMGGDTKGSGMMGNGMMGGEDTGSGMGGGMMRMMGGGMMTGGMMGNGMTGGGDPPNQQWRR
jgi:hypothetical protein